MAKLGPPIAQELPRSLQTGGNLGQSQPRLQRVTRHQTLQPPAKLRRATTAFGLLTGLPKTHHLRVSLGRLQSGNLGLQWVTRHQTLQPHPKLSPWAVHSQWVKLPRTLQKRVSPGRLHTGRPEAPRLQRVTRHHTLQPIVNLWPALSGIPSTGVKLRRIHSSNIGRMAMVSLTQTQKKRGFCQKGVFLEEQVRHATPRTELGIVAPQTPPTLQKKRISEHHCDLCDRFLMSQILGIMALWTPPFVALLKSKRGFSRKLYRIPPLFFKKGPARTFAKETNGSRNGKLGQ